ncbi:MAG TPA: erythromycin esterase family protein [Pyrinomonadaceae bacterium]|nr:erythromycin esterase family protein [Pyrinomonadaceae bacterium]
MSKGGPPTSRPLRGAHVLRLSRSPAAALVALLLAVAPVPVRAGVPGGPPAPAAQEGRAARPSPAEVELVRRAARPLSGAANDYDPLMRLVGDARYVLLGEATHGTHEFYRERARITRRLIEEKGFDAVVFEADWPDAYRVSEYVRGRGKDASPEQALSGFTRFPRWMWRNAEVRDFVGWVRGYNDARLPERAEVSIFGMDIYSLARSAEAVVAYLKRVDPDEARRAARRYDCFRAYADRPERYGLDVLNRERGSCEKGAVEQAAEMSRRFEAWLAAPNRRRDDELFSAYQNARAVRTAEIYYRRLYHREFSTWNLRDSHMAETIHEITRYFEALGAGRAKVAVWAHNTHQGDARMTERGEVGELNVGHLMRRFHDGDAVLVGFTTYEGQVIAAPEWGVSGRRMRVRPALAESYSGLFHAVGVPNFLLVLRGGGEAADALARPRLERAIGVVYLPQTERQSHYFSASLSKQFDAVIHFDVTTAVEPLK